MRIQHTRADSAEAIRDRVYAVLLSSRVASLIFDSFTSLRLRTIHCRSEAMAESWICSWRSCILMEPSPFEDYSTASQGHFGSLELAINGRTHSLVRYGCVPHWQLDMATILVTGKRRDRFIIHLPSTLLDQLEPRISVVRSSKFLPAKRRVAESLAFAAGKQGQGYNGGAAVDLKGMLSISGDEAERPNRRRCSFLALTHGSPTFKAGLSAQRAIPHLGLRVSAASALTLSDTCQSSIEIQCKRFNRYAQYLGVSAGSDQPWETADSVQDTLTEIEQILAQAADSIRAKTAQLERNVKQFTLDVSQHADPRCSERTLDDSKLVETLNKMPLPDAEDFAAYLKERLPHAASLPRPNHEFLGRTFTGKVHLLLERALYESRQNPSVAFSLFATVRAKVLLSGRSRVHPRNLGREQQYVDETLLWMLDQHSEAGDAGDYWGFAAAWRELLDGWQEMGSDPGTFLQLIGPIRKKAQREIRHPLNEVRG
ncbi:uncharacterized protein MYCFIDRAFT_175712 [Pseudocercospora fijiensis CIRAD86]|uniref:Uncharacterized protein n=1 Tax=Pseudocercospora fijiensis (strain CIRAD86) TaxID=383855 RepID=M3AYC4_PSEFD|nr:uncharacterized protein MYCFIDRAFT_175712 [Pseudocercospora fijiensis CIRAD86]EME82168.1 hypothetical protein MYCFIDRAFT_175712 [Pseudocercospora fijiensis CIRAD86]